MDLTYLNTLPRWLRWALALITLIAYALVFVPLYHRIGDTVFILSLLPVLLTGLLLGLWGGLLSAISVFAIIILSLNGLGLANQDLVVPALSLVVLIVVAAAVGRLQDQRERARKQLLERQRAAEALRESEQKYRTLFEASSDAIFVETLDGDVLDCNAAACEMFGYTKEEMFGLNVVDLIPPATAETLPDVIEEHARTGGVFVEAINKRKDGRLFPVEVSTRLVTIDGIDRVIVYVQDITERKQAEEALRASEARYSDLYENANDIIFTVDLAGNFTSANRVAYTALGYGPEAVTDHNLFEVLTPESTEVALELLHQAVEQGRDLSEQQPWELEATRKDGAVRLFEVRTRLIWEDEQVVGFQGIARDITERRRAEERLRKRERLLQGLAQVSQELLRARDVDAALPLALRYLGHATGASRAYLAVNHPGPDGTLSFSWRHEWHAPHIDARAAAWQGISYAGQGLQRWMAAFGRERRIAEPVDNLPASERAALAAQGARSTLMLPLFVSDGWWGFIGLEACDRPRRWQPLEIEMVRTVAGSISSAVERERSQNQYQILSDAAAVLTSTLDLEQVLDRILDQVGRMVPSDTANVMMIEGDEARIVRWRGYEEFGAEDYISSVRFSVSGLENLRQMVEHRKPTIIPDTQESEDWVAVSGLEWLRSYASAPVSVQGEVVGFLNVDSSIPGFFSLAEAYRLQVFADYAAIAIQNARLFQSEQRQTRRLALLADVARIVATTLDMEEMLQAVPEAIHRYFGYPSVMVFLPDEIDGAWVLRGYGGIFTGPPEIDAPGEYRQPVDVGIVGYVARTGESYLTADVRDDPYHYAPEGVAVRSEVCVPIRDEDQLIGVIDVESERLADFDERDRSLLEAVADTVAVGLRNARLFEEARHRAEELAVALAQLEELDRLKDELIQNVSHELRSPLALIRGYAEMLQIGELGRLTPEQQTPVDIIVRRAHMLGDLVQDITLILEAEASRPEPESVRLDALARAAMEDFQIVAAEAQVTLRAEIPDHLPAVQHNTTYLRRVLDNLLGNAVKFTAEGGEIDVRVRQGEDEVVLEVSDTGIGIAPDQLGRVFERFYQVDGSARRRYGGVGLGLSLVKDLVEAYEGTVSVESEVGRGTTFAIRLPLSKSRRASRSPES